MRKRFEDRIVLPPPKKRTKKSGGYRRGAGRPKGKKTQEEKKKARRLGMDAHRRNLSPLQHMLDAMRSEKSSTRRRDEMAKSAAPYIHAKLSSVKVTGGNADDPPVRHEIAIKFVRANHS